MNLPSAQDGSSSNAAPVLCVVAHPDDEVLGAGATLSLLSRAGADVHSCILVAEADQRTRKPKSDALHADLQRASHILGLYPPILGNFPNVRLNLVPHVEMVQFIESALHSTGARIIFTHHPRDLNDDHKHVSSACQAAARLYQRRDDTQPLEGLYFMEIASSTEWSMRGTGHPFDPDTFFEIGTTGLETKLEALAAYRGVMRPYPHPRSREMLHAAAVARGSQAGLNLAEAFQTALRPVRTAAAFTGFGGVARS